MWRMQISWLYLCLNNVIDFDVHILEWLFLYFRLLFLIVSMIWFYIGFIICLVGICLVVDYISYSIFCRDFLLLNIKVFFLWFIDRTRLYDCDFVPLRSLYLFIIWLYFWNGYVWCWIFIFIFIYFTYSTYIMSWF